MTACPLIFIGLTPFILNVAARAAVVGYGSVSAEEFGPLSIDMTGTALAVTTRITLCTRACLGISTRIARSVRAEITVSGVR